jgi:acetyl esterase/lipase
LTLEPSRITKLSWHKSEDGTERRVSRSFARTSPRADDADRRPPTAMGVAWSVLMAEIDASESSSVDEAECRLLFGDAFDEEMWRSAPKDDAGRVTKRTLLQHLGWPSEVFDGRSGTREEARAVNDAAETAARGTPHFYELSPDAARDARRASYVHSAFREDFEVSDAGDDASATIAFAAWRPRDRRTNPSSPEAPLVKPRALYLLFHGGGWVFGDAKGLNDERLEEMADALRVVVLVPDYRKAPERPFPAALDDCEAAAAWCETRARAYFGLDETAPLLIGGESAGGNLCAATLLRRSAKKSEASAKWAFANLVYGIYDVAGTPSVRRFGDRRLVETARDLAYFADCYCPDVDSRTSPEVSPLFADFEKQNLPPASFVVGTEDALVDDTVLMFEKWRAAGNGATLDVWPEGPHGVGHFGIHATTKLGRACRAKVLERIGAFLDAYAYRNA